MATVRFFVKWSVNIQLLKGKHEESQLPCRCARSCEHCAIRNQLVQRVAGKEVLYPAVGIGCFGDCSRRAENLSGFLQSKPGCAVLGKKSVSAENPKKKRNENYKVDLVRRVVVRVVNHSVRSSKQWGWWRRLQWKHDSSNRRNSCRSAAFCRRPAANAPDHLTRGAHRKC